MILRRAVAVGVLSAALAAVWMMVTIAVPPALRSRGRPYVRLYDHPHDALERTLAGGDGQAFAALARDPTLSRPGAFRGGAVDAAYRYERPVLGYAAWIGSLGQRKWVAWAMAVVVTLGAGLAGGSLALLLAARGAQPWLGVAVVALPGSLASLTGVTPEALALGFGATGLVAWSARRRRVLLAVTCFTLAALTRESMLIVPLVVAARLVVDRALTARHVAALAAPLAAVGAWWLVVHTRLGSWPSDATAGRVGGPFVGFADGLIHAERPLMWAAWLALGVGVVAVAVAAAPHDVLTWVAVGFAVFGVLMGPLVWGRWEDFTRPLLPMYAFAGVAVAGSRSARIRLQPVLGA